MTTFGYARVSSTSQDLTIQEEALRAAGADLIRSEKVTGTSIEGRQELKTLLEFLREGDTLLITRIDRLARSVADLQNIVRELKQKGVSLKAKAKGVYTGRKRSIDGKKVAELKSQGLGASRLQGNLELVEQQFIGLWISQHSRLCLTSL